MWETITTAVNATYDYTVETWNAPPIEIDLGALSKWETVLWVWKEVNSIPENHKVFFDLTNRKVIHRPIQTSNAAIIGEAVAQWQKNYHSADTITVLENVVNITEQTLLKCEKDLSHEFIMKTLFPLITILKAGSQSKLEKLATTLNGNANLMTSSSNEQKRFQRIFNLSLRCPEFLDRSEKLVKCVRKTFRNERIPLIINSLKKALGEFSHPCVISELDPELVREQFDTYFSSDAVNKAWKVGNLSREGIGTFNEGDVYAILRHIIIHWNPSDAAFSKLEQIIEMKFISQFSRDDNHLPSERLFHIEDLRRRLVNNPTPPLQFDKEQAARDALSLRTLTKVNEFKIPDTSPIRHLDAFSHTEYLLDLTATLSPTFDRVLIPIREPDANPITFIKGLTDDQSLLRLLECHPTQVDGCFLFVPSAQQIGVSDAIPLRLVVSPCVHLRADQASKVIPLIANCMDRYIPTLECISFGKNIRFIWKLILHVFENNDCKRGVNKIQIFSYGSELIDPNDNSSFTNIFYKHQTIDVDVRHLYSEEMLPHIKNDCVPFGMTTQPRTTPFSFRSSIIGIKKIGSSANSDNRNDRDVVLNFEDFKQWLARSHLFTYRDEKGEINCHLEQIQKSCQIEGDDPSNARKNPPNI